MPKTHNLRLSYLIYLMFFVSIVIRNNIVDPTMHNTMAMNLLITNFNNNLSIVMSKLVNPLY